MEALNTVLQALREKGIPVIENEPLSKHTTFQIGGPAALFCSCRNSNEAKEALQIIKGAGVPCYILGKGSNVLFSDLGFQGVVLQISKDMAKMQRIGENTIFCESGAKLSALCEFAKKQSLTGLEFAFGIPGSVGGAVYMNAGAYGGEMSDVVVKAEHITETGIAGCYEGTGLDLSYRHSAYTGSGKIITGAYFCLTPGDKAEISAKMLDFMGRRKEKQPLEFPSAGSTFKRPANGYASQLIDQCGLKGLSVGGACVSEKHAGFIINRGGATAEDVLRLIGKVQETVLRETGIELEPEIRLVGGNQ